jgi:hypothetical protein
MNHETPLYVYPWPSNKGYVTYMEWKPILNFGHPYAWAERMPIPIVAYVPSLSIWHKQHRSFPGALKKERENAKGDPKN